MDMEDDDLKQSGINYSVAFLIAVNIKTEHSPSNFIYASSHK